MLGLYPLLSYRHSDLSPDQENQRNGRSNAALGASAYSSSELLRLSRVSKPAIREGHTKTMPPLAKASMAAKRYDEDVTTRRQQGDAVDKANR